MSFGVSISNQNTEKKQNYVTWMQIALYRYCKRCWSKFWYFSLWIRPSKGITKTWMGLIKEELGGKIMIEFASLRPKT